MQFTLMKSVTFWWPVTVRMPSTENPGAFSEQVLEVKFAAQSRDDAMAAQEEVASVRTVPELVDFECAQLRLVVKDWRGVVDPEGGIVSFSADALDQALQWSWFRKALFAAYGQCIDGQEARLGN